MYDACFNYGICNGCDTKCPVFLEGKCECCCLDIDILNKMLSGCDYFFKVKMYELYGYKESKNNKAYDWERGD